jgi:hypothetical protein
VGALLLSICSGPAVELWIELLNRKLDPSTVIWIMSTPGVQALLDPQSLPRRFGPWLGLALLAIGLALLARDWRGRREKARAAPKPPLSDEEAPSAARPDPEPIPLPEPVQAGSPVLERQPAPELATTPNLEWFQSSPSVTAQGARRAKTGQLLSVVETFLAPTVKLPTRYRVETKIGAGAMGVVFRAWDQVLNRAVAIKVLGPEVVQDSETSQRFLQEARAMAALSHPNIVTLYDVGVESETPYMVMEFLQGSHLRDVLGDLPNLPEKNVLGYGAQVADALATVHQHRLIHRDVKPENILLLDGTQRVKLMDFGIAHVVQSHKAKGTRPSGTPYYMAPEQITGDELGPWTDIYGLGATLFALLTGSLPFPQGEPLYHAVHTPAPDPREYLPSLLPGTAALILSCLEKQPPKRPQSALDLAAGLRGLAGVDPLPGVKR